MPSVRFLPPPRKGCAVVRIVSCALACAAVIALPCFGIASAQPPQATTAPAPAHSGFVHPGVLLGISQLDRIRTKVNAGVEPWRSAYAQMNSSEYAALDRTATPWQIVECGSNSNPNLGCSDEREDALAAYTDALTWYVTGDHRYADKAIELMDAWATTLQGHANSNAPLQTLTNADNP